MLYYDELEVCNPLGTKTKRHKLGYFILNHFMTQYWVVLGVGIFYYILGNLSPMLRSRLKSIQLFCIGKVSVIVKYGVDAILEPFLLEIKQMEEVV